MHDWLVGIFGEAYATAAFWTIILIAVAVVLLVFLRVNRRFTAGTFISGARGRQPRLAVTDATPWTTTDVSYWCAAMMWNTSS